MTAGDYDRMSPPIKHEHFKMVMLGAARHVRNAVIWHEPNTSDGALHGREEHLPHRHEARLHWRLQAAPFAPAGERVPGPGPRLAGGAPGGARRVPGTLQGPPPRDERQPTLGSRGWRC
eukprot:2684501-Pyramimonas_sp.AAC.1